MNKGSRWIGMVLAGFFLPALLWAGGLSGCLVPESPLSMGRGSAGSTVDPEPFRRVWHRGDVLLLGVGDSVTVGFGATSGHGYFDRLVDHPPEEAADMEGVDLRRVFPKLRTRNLAVSCTVSSEHLLEQIQPLLPLDPGVRGVVVMTTGGNDLIHDYGRTPPTEGAMFGATVEQAAPWVVRFEERLERMVEELKSRFPGGCDIFLATIYDPTDGTGKIERSGFLPPWPSGLELLGAFNDAIRRVAAGTEGVHLVDVHGAMLGHGLFCGDRENPHHDPEDPTYWYFRNLEDPNDRGYDAIRRLFLKRMAEVLGRAG